MRTYTNYEKINSLPEVERGICKRTYQTHPLYQYINWAEFWDSTDGNEMHFLNYIGKFVDSSNKTNIILERYVKNSQQFAKIYICEDNKLIDLPIKKREYI